MKSQKLKFLKEKDVRTIIGLLLTAVLIISTATSVMIIPVRAQEDYDVQVTAPEDAIETEYGNYTYNFTVENTGHQNDTYDLQVQASLNPDFTASAPNQVSVDTNESKKVPVEVQIGEGATSGDSDQIVLTATTQNETFPPPPTNDQDSMEVMYSDYDVEVTAPEDAVETEYGTYNYSFRIKNTGLANDTYDLQANAVHPSFTASAPDQISVDVNKSKEVMVEVQIGETATPGDSSEIILTANSQNETLLSDSDSMNVTYRAHDVAVTAPEDAVETKYGNYTYNFTVENTGYMNDTYDLNVEAPLNQDFTASAPDQVSLDVNQSKEVTVKVQIGEGAAPGDSDEIMLTATSRNETDVSDFDSMQVTYKAYDVQVTAPEDAIETGYGNYTYLFTVENTGYANDTYDLEANALVNPAFTASAPDQVSIDMNQSKEIPVEVQIGEGTTPGDNAEVSLTATSQNETFVSDSDSMQVAYEEYAVKVKAPEDQFESNAGEYSYEFTVANNGTLDDVYDLSVQSSEGDWNVDAPAEVEVPAGQSKVVAVNVTIPGGTVGNTNEVTLTAESKNKTEVTDSDSMNITFLAEEYAVEVEGPADALENQTGTYLYDFTVRNTGSEHDTYDLNVESSNQDWSASTAENISVRSAESRAVEVEVNIPGNAQYGDESEITLTAVSQNQTDVTDSGSMKVSYVENIRVLTVHDPTNGTVFVEDEEVTSGEEQFEFSGGTEVSIEAIAGPDYIFVKWTGDNETIDNQTATQTAITMDGDYEIEAEFALKTYELNIDSTEGGSVVEPGEGTFEYDHGSSVNLQAVADDNYEFIEWTGEVANMENTALNETTITMEDDYTITAVFNQTVEYYELTVNVEGEGEVEITPDQKKYEEGTEVTLTAVPDDGWSFVEWTGDHEDTSEEINITMDSDKTLTAHFEEEGTVVRYELTIDSTEGGEVIEPGEGTFDYTEGKTVELEAVADDDYAFQEWTGNLENVDDSKSSKTTITMENDYTISAVFEEMDTYELTVTVESEGQGEVEITPDQESYEEGTEVELTAIPEDGWRFSEWTGDYEGEEETITVTMDEDKEITAHFEEDVEEDEKDKDEDEAIGPEAMIGIILLILLLLALIGWAMRKDKEEEEPEEEEVITGEEESTEEGWEEESEEPEETIEEDTIEEEELDESEEEI